MNIRKEEGVKAGDGTMLIKKKWAEYFERLLNTKEDREPVIATVRRERVMNVLGELNK